jgi:ubiquinone/menaquinone biosynthesis C-methylase UbiE
MKLTLTRSQRRFNINPYIYVKEATDPDKSLLSLCCGIGFELQFLQTQDVTAVDLAQQYLDEVHKRCPQAKLVLSDALEYAKKQPDNSVDVISIIDGIEHMDKKTGLKLIKEMKRVAKEQVLLFTPQGPDKDGYLKNEPHNAWGIEGADHFQTHKSGWTVEDLKELGFEIIIVAGDTSQHGEPYDAIMARYNV